MVDPVSLGRRRRPAPIRFGGAFRLDPDAHDHPDEQLQQLHGTIYRCRETALHVGRLLARAGLRPGTDARIIAGPLAPALKRLMRRFAQSTKPVHLVVRPNGMIDRLQPELLLLFW
jgi:hypothetical protein